MQVQSKDNVIQQANALEIINNKQLYSTAFINCCDVSKLFIENCPNLIPEIDNDFIKQLVIKRCSIKTIQDLKLQNLEALTIQQQVEYFTFISQISQDIQQLDLIVNYPKLKELTVSNQLKDLAFLSQSFQLTKLDLSSNLISDISALKDMTKLQYIDLSQNTIYDASPLQNLTNLNYLNLAENDIQVSAGLKLPIYLNNLNISYNYVQDIKFLECLNQITTLNIKSNKLENITALKNLINCQELNVSENRIQDITPLMYLKQLTILFVNKNKLVNIDILQHLNNIKTLDLSTNSIVYVYNLLTLNKLQWIDINNNKIQDLQVVKQFSKVLKKCYRDTQKQPSFEEIIFAKNMRVVHKSGILLNQVNQYQRTIQKSFTKFQKTMSHTLQIETYRLINFTQIVINLFEILNRQNE
ncbi:leucine-rich_repeat domain-containing protein [Hexamita inflata]|uniref:Leucine-rich repeat domain-containing protein n=1 Tax=Hexamita inflata TaxID=28002 RepID=A0AA86VLH5_9EUKA|nr:leucine-rich repeat domain-containing protein [Hexamita inflata]